MNRIEELKSRKGRGSISADETFSLLMELAEKTKAVDINAGSLTVRRLYTSVAAMNSDKNPVDQETGKPLKFGQLVCVCNSNDLTQADNGKIYRYNKLGWEFLRQVGDMVQFARTEDLRFSSLEFNCFEMYKTDRLDKDLSTVTASQIYKAFISLELRGFDMHRKYKLSLVRRNYETNNDYSVIIGALDGGAWVRDTYFTVMGVDVESGNPGGINELTAASGDKSMTAIIDYSFIPDGFSSFIDGFENAEPGFVIKRECLYRLDPSYATKEQFLSTVKDGDLELVEGTNIADPRLIQEDKLVSSTGAIVTAAGWRMIGIPVNEGDVITLGRFKLNRSGYSAFYDGTALVLFNRDFNLMPVTLVTPPGATILYVNIKSPLSSGDDHARLTVNKGSELLPFEPFSTRVVGIKGNSVRADTSKMEANVQRLADEMLALNAKIFDLESDSASGFDSESYFQMDLPVTDGSDIKAGYVYIDSATNNVKIK